MKPVPGQAAPQRIRKRLVKLLASSHVVRIDRSDPELVRTRAGECGVTEEIFREAIQRSLEPALDAGHSIVRGHSPVMARLELEFPKPVWEMWQDWCEHMAVNSATALRALIHQYLVVGREYGNDARAWVVRGERYPAVTPKELRELGRWREQVKVTDGAFEALRRRATARNVSMIGILRELVTAALEGRIRTLNPIPQSRMFDDVERYWQPEAFREKD